MRNILKTDKRNFVIAALCMVIILIGAGIYIKSIPLQLEGQLIYTTCGNCVPNEESAIKIAKAIYDGRKGVSIPEEEFGVEYDDSENLWHVWLTNYESDSQGLYINKDYGTVLKENISNVDIQ